MIRILMSFFKPEGQPSQDAAIRTIENCIADIQSWMIDDRLLINDDKTEVLLIVTVRRILMLKVKAGTRHAYTLKQI